MLNLQRVILFLLLAAAPLIGFGHFRLAADREESNGKRRKWPPRLALGLGYSCLAALLLVLAFVVQGLYRLGQLDSAIATTHLLVAAETEYAKSHPEQRYTCNFSELSTGGSMIEKPDLLIKSGQRNGYFVRDPRMRKGRRETKSCL